MTHRRAQADDTENHKRDPFRARLDEVIEMTHSLVRVSKGDAVG